MDVDAPRGVDTRARKRKRDLDAQAGVVIPGLPFDVIVSHILREDNVPDTADLAQLRAVSRGMRDAVDATGREIEELNECGAARQGCLTTLLCLQRRGLLSREDRLCEAAARRGQLEELKALRANDTHTVGRKHVLGSGKGRTPRGAAVAARERLHVERVHVHVRDEDGRPGGAAVGACKWLPVVRAYLWGCGGVRATRDAEVVARERVPVGRGHVLGSGRGQATGGVAVVAR